MQTYEQLKGAIGKQRFYRAERFTADDLFPHSAAKVEIDGELLTLSDVSMTGLAVLAAASPRWTAHLGKELPLRLCLNEEVLVEGRVKVRRVDGEPSGVKIGLSITSGLLDLPDIFAKRDRMQLHREIGESLSNDLDAVDPAYRLFAADVISLLRNYRSLLDRLEARTNGHAAAGSAAVEEALAICEERIPQEWRALSRRGNEIVSPIMGDAKRLRATKRFTERVLTPELLAGPIWRRSYEKPLGYPGDFKIMNQVYEWKSEGDSAYGRLLHRAGLETSECIASRMSIIQRDIAETVATPRQDGREVRITSVGSGPAQEIVNYLGIKSLPQPVKFTLVDQEHQALDQAYRHILPQTIVHGGRASVNCLNISFLDLAKSPDTAMGGGQQDLIYSAGLVDYLGPRRGRQLVAALYERLAPGGQLIIGNMRDAVEGRLWPMEFLCDWTVYFRTEAQMWALSDGLPTESARLETDATGAVYLLYLRKK